MTLEEAVSLAQANYKQGNLDEAERKFREILAQAPSSAAALYWLGCIAYDRRNFSTAETYLRKALELIPNHPMFLNVLGVVAQSQKRLDEAAQLFERARSLKPGFRDPILNLGNVRIAQGRFAEAADVYRQALQLDPAFALAHSSLGVALKEQGLVHEAIESYRRAIELNPALAEAHNNLGVALQGLGQGADAGKHYRRALELNPGFAEGWYNLGNLAKGSGNLDQALVHYRHARQIRPNYEDAIASEAGVYEVQGEYERAYEMLRPLVESGRITTNVAVTFGMLSGHLNKRAEALRCIEQLILTNKVSAQARMSLQFVAGKLNDELGDYDKAFASYHEANAMKPRHFDLTGYTEYVDKLISAYTPELMHSRADRGVESELPIFIVGMPRSGTSLVEQVLASHPAVFGAGELNFMNVTVTRLIERRSYPAGLGALPDGIFKKIAGDYLDFVRGFSTEATRITDKMPGNFMHVGLLRLLFPKARIIHCLRDPIDTCLSCYFQNFVGGHDYAYNLVNLGNYYLQYRRIMSHWQELGIPMLEVRYEEMIAGQEETSRRVIDYSGLAWDERCLRFHETKRVVKTASYDQVRKPLYTKSVDRRSRYERHLGTLKQTLGIA